MRVLVFGASGAVGRFLLPRLLDAQHEIVAISRRARAGGDPRIRWLIGDLDRTLPPLPALDALLSLGPLDGFARWFAQGTTPSVPRLIAFGSTSIDSKRDSGDPCERALAERLAVAEQTMMAAADARGCAWTLLRPTLIYGAGIDRSLTPIARFAQRWHVIPRLPGARGLRQPVHAEDLAQACMAALAATTCTARRTYALGGGERLAFGAMLERVRASLPTWSVPLPIPLGAVRVLARIARTAGLRGVRPAAIARLSRDLIVDHAAAVADFGWAPRTFHPSPATWQAQPP